MSRLLWYTAIYLVAGWAWTFARATWCWMSQVARLIKHGKTDKADELISKDFLIDLAKDAAANDNLDERWPLARKIMGNNIGIIFGWPFILLLLETSFIPRIKLYVKNILDEEKES